MVLESRIDNGILEGINSLIQACKAKARDYRSKENLISMIYLIAGKLPIGLPAKKREEPDFITRSARTRRYRERQSRVVRMKSALFL